MRPADGPTSCGPCPWSATSAKFADGSVLVRLGDTHVLCTAKSVDGVPGWRRGTRRRLADRRVQHAAGGDRRPHAARGGARQAGRAHPGDPAAHRPQPAGGGRPRASIGERTLYIDCDVRAGRRRHAHGGRLGRLRGARASPSRSCAAGARWPRLPLFDDVAAVSVGVVDGEAAARPRLRRGRRGRRST